MHPLILIGIFVAAALIGYRLIGQVPSLLHTPLMSGMNALSGITLLGALTATGAAMYTGSRALGGIAIFLAMINVAGGFGVTHRMLRMFKSREDRER
ncbi:MAG: NAD(P) transhydrogenase subunit alpha [Christensenellales bacterium]|jgi:NAD(P) transhydrogenase subunit alpha